MDRPGNERASGSQEDSPQEQGNQPNYEANECIQVICHSHLDAIQCVGESDERDEGQVFNISLVSRWLVGSRFPGTEAALDGLQRMSQKERGAKYVSDDKTEGGKKASGCGWDRGPDLQVRFL